MPVSPTFVVKCGRRNFWKMTVPVDRDFIRKRLDKIVENEHRAILQQVADVDASYRQGQGNSPRWILERAQEIAIGMRRAGAGWLRKFEQLRLKMPRLSQKKRENG